MWSETEQIESNAHIACLSANLIAPTDIDIITVRDAETGYEDWTDATDDLASWNGEHYFLCGNREFVVWDVSNNEVSWITITQPDPSAAPVTWRMNYAPLSPTGTVHQGFVQQMTLRISNPSYPHMGVYQHTFYVTITSAICDC